MPKLLNLVGDKYGYWTVLSEGPRNKTGARQWLCRCVCGKEKIILQSNLRSGKTKSCGCINKTQDLTGLKFNRLTVIEKNKELSKKRGESYWICKCDCGNIINVTSANLKNETTKSCGCYKSELASMLGKSKFKDLTGQRFGRLKVLSLVGKDESNRYQYLCECDCGNQIIVRASSLTSKNTKSCGQCTHISFGEEKIKQLLDENDIYYEYQKSFPSCQYESGRYAKFDFYIDNRYILEFDGKQHFEATSGWNTKEQVAITQKRDNFKNDWCKKNNIPIIRIPYIKLKTLVFEDIWLPT